VNTLITPLWVTKDVAVNFKNSLKFLGQFDRTWDKTWENLPGGTKIGYTSQVRIQQRFTVTEGQGLVQQPLLNQTVPLTINHQYQIGMGWSSADDALVIEEVQNRYTTPAGRAMASKWDAQAGLEVASAVYFNVGTPGVPLTGNDNWTAAVALLDSVAVPDDDYVGVIDPKTRANLLNANFALFQPKNNLFRTGQFADEALGVGEWYTDALMPVFTTGTFTTATPITSSGGQTGSSLALSGMGTYAMVRGDRFTVAGVNAVNPVAYTDTGILQQFVLTAALSGTTTGTFSISPAIITSGPLQTVTASPANGAAVSWSGATGTVSATMAATSCRQSFVFNRAAFAFVMADLPERLAGALAKRVNDEEEQLSLRWVEQYQISTDQMPSRVDSIGGVGVILPYFAVAMLS
jgi:P22 coat protein - gene protein 5